MKAYSKAMVDVERSMTYNHDRRQLLNSAFASTHAFDTHVVMPRLAIRKAKRMPAMVVAAADSHPRSKGTVTSKRTLLV